MINTIVTFTKIKLVEMRVYREAMIINFVLGLAPVLINIFLWRIIFQVKGGTIGGYDFSKMITYFLLVSFVVVISNSRNIAVEISEQIKNGSISNILIKPISIFKYYFSYSISERLIYLLNISVPLMIFAIILRNLIVIKVESLFPFLISCILSIVLNFMVYFNIGILASWIEECSSILDLWRSLSFILSGGAFPLSLIKGNLEMLFSLFPFKYMLFTPINIYLGNLTPAAIAGQIFIQLLWIAILYITYRVIWRKASYKITGHGL